MKNLNQSAPTVTKSSVAGVLLVAYVALVVYASLYPFVGWRSQGLWPWHFVVQPLPYYWTAFDATINVLGYLPLGMLLMWARLRHSPTGLVSLAWGVILWLSVTLAGCGLSGLLEAIQTYLSPRKASNLDWALNTLGTAVGAVAGGLLYVWVRRWSRLRLLHTQWLALSRRTGARGVLILLGLWLLALLYPSGLPFVLTLPQWLAREADWPECWAVAGSGFGAVV